MLAEVDKTILHYGKYRRDQEWEKELQERKLQQEEESRKQEEQKRLEQERLQKEQAEIHRQKKTTDLKQLFHAYRSVCAKLENETQQEIQKLEQALKVEETQAQEQINDLQKQKESFTLFRKKRDAELDAKIQTLTAHIETMRQALPQKIADCEAQAQTKWKDLLCQLQKNAADIGVILSWDTDHLTDEQLDAALQLGIQQIQNDTAIVTQSSETV